MSSYVSVCSQLPLPMMHWTSLYRPIPSPGSLNMGPWDPRAPAPLDMGPQDPSPPGPGPSLAPPSDMGPQDPFSPCPASLLVTSDGHHWKPVQICSLQEPPPTSAEIYSGEAPTVGASMQYTSYWSAFLFM